MGRLVYACRFDVPGNGNWAGIELAYANWIKNRYSRAHETAVELDVASGDIRGHLPPHHALNLKRFNTEGNATELEWVFPGDHGLIWRNIARFGQLSDGTAVEHRIELSSADYLLAPARFVIGAPGVIRTICKRYDIRVGDMQLRATAYPLRAPGLEEFASLLHAEQRRLPIVLTTPFANGTPNDIDTHLLADHLAGVGIVAEADSPETTRGLSEQLGRFGCFDGGVRVYWPGFRLSDDLRKHPLMLGSRIAILGAERAAQALERSIFSIAAFRFVSDLRISEIINANESAQRLERAEEAVQQGDMTWEKYALEISEKLDGALSEIEGLKAENANLRENQSVLFSFSDREEEVEEAEETSQERDIQDVLQAVEYAKADCAYLDFLDSSLASAEDSPFKRPSEVYNDLIKMNKVAGVWARNQGSGDLRLMLIDEGLGRRVSNFISKTAKGKWGTEYTFQYNGKAQVFEWHVTLGAGSGDTCASIHFLPDPERGKLVIAHVGRHLTNTRS